MSFIDNESELQAEHTAAKAAKEAEEQAKEEQERTERQQAHATRLEQERKERNAKLRKHYEAIQTEVVKKGHNAQLSDDNQFTIDTVTVGWYLSFNQEYGGSSSWRRKPTGRLRCTTGDYGNRTSYPQRKDGTFNYEAIATTLIGYAVRKNAEDKRSQQRAANLHAAEEIRKEFGVEDYRRVVGPSSTEGKPIALDLRELINPCVAVTPEHARKILTALRQLGFKLSYNEKQG